MYDRSRGGYQRPVFDAVDDGNGNIELSYAIADRFERVSNNRSVATFQVSHGIYSPDGRTLNVHGIDMDAVKSFNGTTYDIRTFLKENGFRWSRDSKSWVR